MSMFNKRNKAAKQERDKFLFKELDKHSTKIRNAASELADFLMTLNSHAIEIMELIEILQKIKNGAIEEIDKAIDNFKKSFLQIDLHADKKNQFIQGLQGENMIVFLKKQDALNREAVLLVEKAFEINKKAF